MIADQRFLKQPRRFWADIRTISQAVGYTVRRTKGKKSNGAIKVPTSDDIAKAYEKLHLRWDHLFDRAGTPTEIGQRVLDYFRFRAASLNRIVEPLLMDEARAKATFKDLKQRLKPKCPIPMNKQKKAKKAPAYLTGLVNMLIEASCGGQQCNYNPLELTTVTRDGVPVRTLARRVDGAFPSAVNPIAVWESKSITTPPLSEAVSQTAFTKAFSTAWNSKN